jgi:hypothetical protein
MFLKPLECLGKWSLLGMERGDIVLKDFGEKVGASKLIQSKI